MEDGMRDTETMLEETEIMSTIRAELATRVAGMTACCEEFYNTCHGKGGKFCPTSGSGKGGGGGGKTSGKLSGRKTIKQQMNEGKANIATRRGSPNLKKVTTSYGGSLLKSAVLSVTLGGRAAVPHLPKLRKLAKTDIKPFSDGELKFLHRELKKDQARHVAFLVVNAAQGDAVGLGYTMWRAKRTPAQVTRVEVELSNRKVAFNSLFELPVRGFESLMTSWTFVAEDALPTLTEEITEAKRLIANGNLPEYPKPSAAKLKECGKWLADLESDEDAGLTAKMVKGMKESFERYQKTSGSKDSGS